MEINPLLRTIDNTAIGVQRTWTHSLHLHFNQHTHDVKVNVHVDANVKCEQALKVHSNGAAAATAFFCAAGGNGKVMHKHECFTLPLPLPHRMGSKTIYLRHNCCSHISVNESIS